MNTRHRPSRPRRGVALLLVLVTMATATTLAIGWLSSQDNATLVGRNVVATTEARCIASSGLDLAVSVMQTESEWRTLHSQGVLFSDLQLGHGTVELVLVDPTTNEPPTSDSMEVHVIATATVDSISQSVAAYVSLLQDDEHTDIREDVSGFALFSLSTIDVNDNATIARWSAAPASVLGRRLALGTASGHSRSISITDNAAAIDATVYHGQAHSPALLVNSTAFDVDAIELPWEMSLDGRSEPLASNTPSRSPNRRRSARLVPEGSLRLGAGDVHHVTGSDPLLVDGDLHLATGARIVVEGAGRIEVGGRLIMDDAAIDLLPGATLHAVVGQGATLDDAVVGGTGLWTDPDRITLASGCTESGAHPWIVRGDSSITGCIEGPAVDFVIEDDAVLKGRIAANRITLNDSACVLYDHGLDDGLSLPRAGQLLQDATDTRRAMKRLPSDFVEQLVELGRQRTKRSGRAGKQSTRRQRGGARHWRSEPTPRPIPVECRLLTHGFDACGFEAMVSRRESTR